MRIVPLLLLFPTAPRSNDEWLVGEKGGHVQLKASATASPNQPPSTGWEFYTWMTREWLADETISSQVSSPPCCLTVSLSGAAKEAKGECEGEYKSTGLVSMGREVKLQFDKKKLSSFFEGVQAGRLL